MMKEFCCPICFCTHRVAVDEDEEYDGLCGDCEVEFVLTPGEPFQHGYGKPVLR